MTLGQVENAIIDDEIRTWLAALRAKGAFVWILFDACHSGTMVRGSEQERSRHIPIETLIPAAVLQQHEAGRERVRGQKTDTGILGLPDEAGEIVAMYAAQSFEQAPEGAYPLGSETVHGLFTYTLTQVLTESQSPVTYRELVERVTAKYRSVSRRQPTPLLEGGGLDRLVLGEETLTRPKMLLKGKDWDHPGRFLLRAGSLHGLQRGTILAVYPPAGAAHAETPVGHVKIVDLSPLTASVTPVEFDGMTPPQEEQLSPGSRCEAVFVDYGDLRLKIAIQAPLLKDAFELLAADRQFAALVERVDHDADWFVRMAEEQILLIPASGFATDVPPQFKLGAASDAPEILAKNVKDALLKIARAQNLMQIAARGSQRRARGTMNVGVEVDVLYFEDDFAEGTVVPPGSRVFREGDLIAFQVKNPSRLPIDVTLLIIDNSYGITSFYPLAGSQEDNRLAPGGSFITPLGEIEGGQFGPEQLVAIAVGVDQTRTGKIDFACLEQTALERVRGDARSATALDTPLGRLLETALYGEGAVRGVPRASLGNYALQMVNWRTMPRE